MTTLAARSPLAPIIASVGLALSACVPAGGVDETDTTDRSDTDSAPVPRALFIHIETPDGTPLPSYVAVVRRDDVSEEWVCPAKTTDAVTCDAGRLVFSEAPESLTVTIKSPGYGFVTRSWSSGAMSDLTETTITMTALAPFEANDDYATGFGPSASADDFAVYAKETSGDLGAEQVVKFYIEAMDTAPVVYFMNTSTHFLHYPFVRNVLGNPISEIDFQQETYVDANRTAMAGTLISYPDADIAVRDGAGRAAAPMVMTFFPSDRLTPKHAATAHRLLEERLGHMALSGEGHRLFYLPPGELQRDALLEQTAAFEDAGIPWMQKDELFAHTDLQILNEGEAYGTLRRLSAEQLETALFSFQDILILTTLPSTLPLVGGTITEMRQTPLSHVNVAAMNRGTPNIALPNAGASEAISALIGTTVHFVVRDGAYTLEPATAAEAEAFWASQRPPEVSPIADTEYSELLSLDDIAFADSIRFGAKAANVAELHGLLGEQAPYGFAVPFFYYDQFVQSVTVTPEACRGAAVDCVEDGRTDALCAAAAELCEQHATITILEYIEAILDLDVFVADATMREALLAGIRYVFRTTPVDPTLADDLNGRVLELFGSTKVRLRSSTNAEDLPEFSGAGLYDSVSAEGDEPGDLPSDEIRKVWASTWNFRAFEERRFWNINHLSVHMGVLVHQAFPNEAANGVLITRNIAEPRVEGFYVNVQPGETSVTNPPGQARPEIFAIIQGAAAGNVQSAVYAYADLMPNQRVLTDEEIRALYEAARQAQHHFAALYGINFWEMAAFDLEFKFHGPNRDLIIKQLRPFL